MFPKTAWLPRLVDYAKQVPGFGGLTLHGGILFGIVAAVVVWFIISRSRWGYEIRLIGDNPRAANYAGINIVRNTVLVMMVSGGLAGLAGMSEISGVVHRLQGAISPGYGFTGIIIAWLAKLNPFAVVLVSILFGGLILAGREIQPSGVPRMLQGIILFCVIASDVLLATRPHRAPCVCVRERVTHAYAARSSEDPMIDWIIILQAGVATGTVLLFATIGEILAERSGVLNLGVEGMMLIGAMTAFSTAVSTGQPWLGVLLAMLAAGRVGLLHAVVTISFQADQVVSGLAINFVGIGLSLVLGEGLSKAGTISLLPIWTIPGLSQIPILGPILFTNQSVLVYLGYLLTPAVWYLHQPHAARPAPARGGRVSRRRPTRSASTSTACATSTCSSAG